MNFSKTKETEGVGGVGEGGEVVGEGERPPKCGEPEREREGTAPFGCRSGGRFNMSDLAEDLI